MDARADSLVLREADLSEEEYTGLAESVRQVCTEYGVDFYVHRHWNVCRNLSYSRIHLSFDGFQKMEEFHFRPEYCCVSVHSVSEAKFVNDWAEHRNGKYSVMFGNVFETSCKPGVPARGTEIVSQILREIRIPLYVIGGISWERIPELKTLGVYGFAMRSQWLK